MAYIFYILSSIAIVILIRVIPILCNVTLIFRKMYKTRQALLRDFPVPEYHWLSGHLKTFPGINEEGLMWFSAMAQKYPRYYVFIVGPTAVLQVHHPETIKQITKTAEPKQFTYGSSYTCLFPWIGDGLLLSSGNKWFRNRKLLTPGFHFDVLKPYIGIYNNCVETLMEIFNTDSASVGESVDVYKPVSRCSLDIILQCAFSSKQNLQAKDRDETYAHAVSELGRLVVERALSPFMYLDFVYYKTRQGKLFRKYCEYSHKIADDVIAKRQIELRDSDTIKQLSNKRYVDFLDILLLAKDEDGNGLTPREIRDEVETFMFEGHDTTASGISWLLYNLANNPDVQERARQEVDALLDGRHPDEIAWEDMNELPYLTRCIKESLRLHSTVPLFGRELSKPLQMDDKIIPAGVYIDINIWNLHHNPDVWNDPMTYDPDRFLPEKMAKMDSHAFMPFSAGPRNCIGQNFAMNEMRTTVARIIRRFDLSVDKSKEIKMHPDVVMRSKSGIHLFFNTRVVE